MIFFNPAFRLVMNTQRTLLGLTVQSDWNNRTHVSEKLQVKLNSQNKRRNDVHPRT